MSKQEHEGEHEEGREHGERRKQRRGKAESAEEEERKRKELLEIEAEIVKKKDELQMFEEEIARKKSELSLIEEEIKRKRAELAEVARQLLDPAGKNPYYFEGIEIRNLRELVDNLDRMPAEHAMWLASWIEYLGDTATAAKIRERPSDFREIIRERYEGLMKFVEGADTSAERAVS